jgi:hypothetical protein
MEVHILSGYRRELCGGIKQCVEFFPGSWRKIVDLENAPPAWTKYPENCPVEKRSPGRLHTAIIDINKS